MCFVDGSNAFGRCILATMRLKLGFLCKVSVQGGLGPVAVQNKNLLKPD